MGEPDRLEREIEELLGKIEDFPGPDAKRARKPSTRPIVEGVARRQQRVARELSRVSVSQVMLFAFLLILGSFFFREFGLVAVWAMYAGVVLFVVSFAIMMFGGRGRASRRQKTVWRGRNASYGGYARTAATRPSVAGQPAATSLLVRLRRWLSHRNHHPRA